MFNSILLQKYYIISIFFNLTIYFPHWVYLVMSSVSVNGKRMDPDFERISFPL